MSQPQSQKVQIIEDGVLVATKDLQELPEEVRYVEFEGKEVPLAKLVALNYQGKRAIEEYAADGRLLRRSFEIKGM